MVATAAIPAMVAAGLPAMPVCATAAWVETVAMVVAVAMPVPDQRLHLAPGRLLPPTAVGAATGGAPGRQVRRPVTAVAAVTATLGVTAVTAVPAGPMSRRWPPAISLSRVMAVMGVMAAPAQVTVVMAALVVPRFRKLRRR